MQSISPGSSKPMNLICTWNVVHEKGVFVSDGCLKKLTFKKLFLAAKQQSLEEAIIL